jgi:hypothetical protein
MNKFQKLTLHQETLGNLSGFDQTGFLASIPPAGCHSQQVSLCNACIPPTETPNCNPAV